MDLQKCVDVISNFLSSPEKKRDALDYLNSSFLNQHKECSTIDLLTPYGSTLAGVSSDIVHSLVAILRSGSSNSSLIKSANQLLATITHNNDDMRLELAKLKIIKILLSLLTPPTPINYERAWEWVPVQEQVLSALRKVTFRSETNQSTFLRLGGASKIIKACHHHDKEINHYPPQTKKRLRNLLVDELLIGAVIPVLSKDRNKMASLFPVLSLLKTINYPMYHVDLADKNKTWLTDTLIKEGLALPHIDTQLPEEGVAWIIVRGTHVAGPTALWVQYSLDKASQNVLNMFQSLQELDFPSPFLSDPLCLGNVYAVYVEEQREDERREDKRKSKGSWYRGWLLELPTKSKTGPTFFCMDYGFTVTVSAPGCVTELPQQCRGVPPQAVPCVLGGIKPPPKSYILHRHVAAILGNIAHEKEINRREIASVGGIELLLELITSLDTEVQTNALGALINLSHSKVVCQKLRQLGSVQTLTELCIYNDKDLSISKLALGVLTNLLLQDSVECIEVCNVFNVYQKLIKWREIVGSENEKLNETISHLLTAIEAIQKGEVPVLATETQPLLTCAPFPKLPSSTSSRQPDTLSSLPDVVSVKSVSDKTTPKKVTPKKDSPVYRVLSQNQRATSSSPSLTSLSLLETYALRKGGNISVAMLSSPQSDSSTHCCVHLIDIRCVNNLMESITGTILKAMCALGNEENGGSIYIGIDNNSIVHGLAMSRNEKDSFCIKLDGIVMSHLQPPLDDRYTLSFLPVYGANGEKETPYCIICIKVIPSHNNVIHLVVSKKKSSLMSESCYVSRQGHSVKLSFLEVQKLVESREVKKYEQLLNNDDMTN